MSLGLADASAGTAPTLETPRRSFEECIAEWRGHLVRHAGPIGSLRWVLRENLSAGDAGDGERDPSVSLHFQCLAPALSPSDVGGVFERERAGGRPVHFELVAAQPEALLVSLRREPTWARHVESEDGITMQVEPSFHSFVEVSDLDTWRRLTTGHARDGSLAVLESVLPLTAAARTGASRATRH